MVCRYWHRLETGTVTLPEGALILIGNHRCGLDPLLVQASVDRPLCFMMAREYYNGMVGVRWLFKVAGAIPVNPGGANRHALREAIEVLKGGGAICIFPEGEANPVIPLKRILPGAALLAIETGAPLMPFRIRGVWPFDHVHVWRGLFRRGRPTIRFGNIFYLDGLSDSSKFTLRSGIAAIRKELHAMR